MIRMLFCKICYGYKIVLLLKEKNVRDCAFVDCIGWGYLYCYVGNKSSRNGYMGNHSVDVICYTGNSTISYGSLF